MSEIKPNQFNGEFAALQHQREMESLSRSPFVETVVGTAASAVDMIGLPIGGLIRWALKSGQTPLEAIVEQIESSATAAIARHEKRLDGHDKELKEFREALQSQGAQTAYRAAVFHGMRTSDPAKHMRLGTLTINCIYVDDLAPESLDGMMRATTELTGRDISILVKVAEIQARTATFFSLTTGDGTINRPREVWKALEDERFISPQNQMEIRVSLARLQSVGFGAEIQTTDSTWHPRFLVTPLGERFIERLQEI